MLIPGKGCLGQECSRISLPYCGMDAEIVGNYLYQGLVKTGYPLYVINIMDPTNPQTEGIYHGVTYLSGITFANNLLYVTDYHGDPGLQILDISDPVNPVRLGSLDVEDLESGVAVRNGYAYLTSNNSTFRVVDVSDPANPSIVSTLVIPGTEHQRDLIVHNGYAFISNYGIGLSVVHLGGYY